MQKFHMSVLKYHKSSFERQKAEAVKIQSSRQSSTILNSKSEYNRSSIPRLGVKTGHKVFKTKKEFECDEQRDEDENRTEEKIRLMRKEMGKRNQRRMYDEESLAPKKRKTGDDEYKCSRKATGDECNAPNEKRK